MKVTQQEIADILNLSDTTVSRCFTNHPKINPETRSKVFQLANKLGYSYRAVRNTNKAGDEQDCSTIAVLVGFPKEEMREGDTASKILNGISERAAISGTAIQVYYLNPDEFSIAPGARRAVKNVNISDWSGVLLMFPFNVESVKNLIGKVPTLSILDDYDELSLDCVESDQHHGINAIMDRLIALGHTNIGFVSWEYQIKTKWADRRFGTYLEHMYLSGLKVNPENIINMLPGRRIATNDIAEYLAGRTRAGATAWVFAADHQAYYTLPGLKKYGIEVPRDCSITGFDGMLPPEGLPQLTTVAVPLEEIGFSAVHELERKMTSGIPKCRHVMVAGKLIKGETTSLAPPI
ncbi:MAG: LacI family DNA-binding transcriptional regulator [Opitutales bacterium]|nr:LacI family DNA-binding transcriptional regulator [Opitutales bacterium]